MERTPGKHLLLILSRELAANVSTPMIIIDPDGTLIYFNEASEPILGETFAHTGELRSREWAERWHPQRLDGVPFTVDDSPLGKTMIRHRPASAAMVITGTDGVRRTITIASYPLLAHDDDFVGAVAIFWESGDETA